MEELSWFEANKLIPGHLYVSWDNVVYLFIRKIKHPNLDGNYTGIFYYEFYSPTYKTVPNLFVHTETWVSAKRLASIDTT